MRRLIAVSVAASTLATGAAVAAPAAAQVRVDSPGFERTQYYGGRGYDRGGYDRGYGRGYDNRRYYGRRNNGGDEAAAAIIGGVLGFALGQATAPRQSYYPSYGYGSNYYSPPPVYYAPPRYYAPPPRVHYPAPRPYYGRPCYGYGYGC